MYYKETIKAGKTIIRTLKASTRENTMKKKRKAKTNPTSEAVKKVNFRNAVKMLTAKLNHNFKANDIHLTLTYDTAPDPQAAKAELKKFIRNLRSCCKKNNIEFKWIAVTEYKHARIHHHIVMSDIDIEIIKKYWKHGYIKPVLLDGTGNYYRLAEYLLKETEKTFREDNSPQKKRYTCSKNIVTPLPYIEKMSGKKFREEIQPDKGYYIDQDTVRKYHHAILDVDCMSCIMIRLKDQPTAKRTRGKKGRYERHYPVPREQQIEFTTPRTEVLS